MDAFKTVSLNGRPFKVDYGGLPMPIISNGKKHFVRFLKLPPGCVAGKTVVAGMRGELPTSQPDQKSDLSESSLNALSHMEHDSNSQDSSDLLSSEPGIKTPSSINFTANFHLKYRCKNSSIFFPTGFPLDHFSSAMSSHITTAPASGLSYRAEPMETTVTAANPAAPVDLKELFKRLVETGIVSSQKTLPQKKLEEEEEAKPKEPEIKPVSFDKPETLKMLVLSFNFFFFLQSV